MSTLIIVESYFGNTLQIAHAIADALPNAKLQSFDEAPDAIPDDIDADNEEIAALFGVV